MSQDWKDIWQSLKKENKKLLGLVVLGIIGLAMLVYTPGGGDNSNEIAIPEHEGQQDLVSESDSPAMAKKEQQLSNHLENMLSQISGAGEVRVSLRLSDSIESKYAVDTETMEKVTTEEDDSGGTRKIEQIDEREAPVMIKSNNGNEKPVIEKQIAPEIGGIMVIAEGAVDPEVKARLYRAVRVSMGVEPHKVRVFPMERND